MPESFVIDTPGHSPSGMMMRRLPVLDVHASADVCVRRLGVWR